MNYITFFQEFYRWFIDRVNCSDDGEFEYCYLMNC